ncbi:MAG TPA: LON peptidase substrate-binding domain-containing protein, partial [Acidimicrobiales bacterium]|nr:LON peptidase substrate-binding domain-containing protein [Acidimicrobiales bacterium]
MPVTPMFPLGTVLVPGMLLPLHVFEPRYRQMLDDCLAGDRTFGVVLIERGSEVGGGDVRTGVGTLARILQAEQAADGRWALMAVGARRIRIDRWLPDDPYPRAE